MKRIGVILLLVITLSAVLTGGAVVHAQNDTPITMTIEPDPDCQLTEAGEMSFLRFTLKNESAESYTMKRAVLSGELLPQALAFEEDIVIEGNEVKEFKVQKLSVPLSAFDRELTFSLSWQEEYFMEYDEEHLFPLYEEKTIEARVVIERFSEPVLELSYKTEAELVAVGEQVEIIYVLKNDTKFDMTGLSLYDSSVSTGYIPLESTELKAGETMEVPYTFPMGEVDVVVNPCVEYTVRGEKQLAVCEQTYTIQYLKVELKLDIQQYPSTEDGTLFALTVTNSGTHTMKDIRLYDEIGTELDEPFDLAAGQSKSLTYTVAAAVAADSPRMVSFSLTAKDYLEKEYTLTSSEAYEVKPYVASDQVNLQLIVTLSQSKFNEDGSLLVSILFEIRNYSAVPISNGLLTENSAFNGTVREYGQLNNGVTTFYKDFNIVEGASVLSFILTAQDPAGNIYATEPMTLDVTGLLQRKQEGSNASGSSQTIDTTGTIYDTEKYIKLFRRVLLVLFILIVLLLAGSAILYVYEQSLLSTLPPDMPEPAPTVGKTGQEGTDTARLQFGYVQPAKLRYMESRRQEEPLEEEEAEAADSEEEQVVLKAPPGTKDSSDTSPFSRPEHRGSMVTEEHTRVFPAVGTQPFEEEGDTLFRRPETPAEEEIADNPVQDEPLEPKAPETAPAGDIAGILAGMGKLQQGEPAVQTPAFLTKEEGKKPNGAPRSLELRPKPKVLPKEPARPLRMGGGEEKA